MEATKAFGAWAAESPRMLSDVAKQRAQEAIFDVVACMVAGAGDEGSARGSAAGVILGASPALRR